MFFVESEHIQDNSQNIKKVFLNSSKNINIRGTNSLEKSR